jgi:geranylgeranyl diphosphate synthase type I
MPRGSIILSLRTALEDLLPLIEADLQEITRPPQQSLRPYYGMMHYHLGWVDEELQPRRTNSGKRLRPLLCLLACRALGGNPLHALPAASALELIHNFSLVHDDIQDGSHIRRGRQAVWDIWGMPHGINVGDGLFVLARLALHRLENHGVSPSRRQAAALTLDRACLELCEGQYFDLAFEDQLEIDLDQYLWMIRHKTAALLAAAAQMGAIVATDDTEQLSRYYRFGESLGMAFQIQDDILGTWGDEKATGKSAATDIRDKKKTLLVVYTLDQTRDRRAAQRLTDLYAQPAPLDKSAIQVVQALFEEVGAHQYAEEAAEKHYRAALQSLKQTGIDNRAQSNLCELAASLLGRQS